VSYTAKIILALVNQTKTACSPMTGNIFHGIYLSPQRVIIIYMGKPEISVGNKVKWLTPFRLGTFRKYGLFTEAGA